MDGIIFEWPAKTALKIKQDRGRPPLAHGYQLETSSLGDNPILRRLKDNTELRATANRRTIETLKQRELIIVAKAGGVLNPTVWRLTSKASREVSND